MGNICTNNFEKQQGTETIDTYKNVVQYEGSVGDNCTLSIILGHYRQHRSDAFISFTQLKHIHQCDPIKDYTSDPQKTIEIVSNMRKSFYKAPVRKNCPYKKLLLCVLPTYVSEQRQAYEQKIRNLLREVFQSSKDVTIQLLNTIQNVYSLPNQLILSVLMEQLKALNFPAKWHMITTEKKMMNLYKYELIKSESFKAKDQLD